MADGARIGHTKLQQPRAPQIVRFHSYLVQSVIVWQPIH